MEKISRGPAKSDRDASSPVAKGGDLGGSFPNLRGQRPRLQCLRLPLPPVAEVGDLGGSFPNLRGQRPRLQYFFPPLCPVAEGGDLG